MKYTEQTLLDRAPNPEYLKRRAQALALPKPKRDEVKTAYFVFQAGNAWLALPSMTLVEVHPIHPVRSLPIRSNAVFLGLSSAKGAIMLVVGLHSFFEQDPFDYGNEATPKLYPRMLEVLFNKDRYLIPVNRILGSTHKGAQECSPVNDMPYVKYAFEMEGRTIWALDPEAVFAAWRTFVA